MENSDLKMTRPVCQGSEARFKNVYGNHSISFSGRVVWVLPRSKVIKTGSRLLISEAPIPRIRVGDVDYRFARSSVRRSLTRVAAPLPFFMPLERGHGRIEQRRKASSCGDGR